MHAQSDARGKEILIVKGAPEVIVAKCCEYLNKNGIAVPTDTFFDMNFRETVDKLVQKVSIIPVIYAILP